jgi:hypothetical protein
MMQPTTPSLLAFVVQRSPRHEKFLVQATVGCFTVPTILIMIAGVLVSTGRYQLTIDVDAAVIVGDGMIGFT